MSTESLIDGGQQIFAGRCLEDVTYATRLESSFDEGRVLVNRQKDNSGAAAILTKPSRRLDSANVGHRDVHHENVWCEAPRGLDQGLAVSDLPDDIELGLEYGAHLTKQGVIIVGDQNLQALHSMLGKDAGGAGTARPRGRCPPLNRSGTRVSL